MQLTDDQIDRILRLSEAWADAEAAIKISEQQVGDVIIPAIKELRYAGRKLAKGMSNYAHEKQVTETDREIEDAIFDCFRARHDATDATVNLIALRMEAAIEEFGVDAVKRHFSAYEELSGLLVEVHEAIANARENGNDRHVVYAALEAANLPRIVKLFSQFKSNEQFMKREKTRNWLAQKGINFGWFVALVVALAALWRSW